MVSTTSYAETRHSMTPRTPVCERQCERYHIERCTKRTKSICEYAKQGRKTDPSDRYDSVYMHIRAQSSFNFITTRKNAQPPFCDPLRSRIVNKEYLFNIQLL